jgi:PhnB protein
MTIVKPVPEGYRTATPYLIIRGAAEAIEFYKRAFGATEVLRMADPQGRVGHAEIRIGDSVIMLADEHPSFGYRGPRSLGGSSVSILLYMEDVDAVFERAVKAGGRLLRPVTDQFYGDRSGTLEDPFGHVWTVATHVEDAASGRGGDEVSHRRRVSIPAGRVACDRVSPHDG